MSRYDELLLAQAVVANSSLSNTRTWPYKTRSIGYAQTAVTYREGTTSSGVNAPLTWTQVWAAGTMTNDVFAISLGSTYSSVMSNLLIGVGPAGAEVPIGLCHDVKGQYYFYDETQTWVVQPVIPAGTRLSFAAYTTSTSNPGATPTVYFSYATLT